MNRDLVNNHHPSPLFFVSVDSKGVSVSISPLFSTLAREFTSVDSKRPTHAIHLLESNGMGHEDFKELDVRSDAATQQINYSISVLIGKWLLVSRLDAAG